MATVEQQPFLPSLHTTLPPEFIRTDIDRPNIPHNHFCNDIPIISLAELFPSPSSPPDTSTLARLSDACADWGVFILVDHGVDPKLISSISDLSARFFSLPPEKKLEYVTGEGKQGGFNVSSHLKGEPVQDWREFFTFFSYPEEVRDYSRWPEEPEGWKDTIHKYCEVSMRVASDVLEGLSLSLGAEKEAMKKACVRLEQKLLVNFYPKCSQPNLTLGLRRHTDPGTITLLLQDKVGGLQVTRDGGETWVTVPPVEGSFVVNLGDHGHYLSNGRFKSVEHRAVVNSNHSRLSIATFQYPAQDAVIIPLKKEEHEKSILEPMTFTEMYKRKMTYDIQVAKHREEEARNHQAITIAETKLNGNHI